MKREGKGGNGTHISSPEQAFASEFSLLGQLGPARLELLVQCVWLVHAAGAWESWDIPSGQGILSLLQLPGVLPPSKRCLL